MTSEYKIFRHPANKIEAVKQGWSWPAFFFNSIWALVKKMWVLGGVLTAALFLAGVIGEIVGGAVQILIIITEIAISVLFGLGGNSWRESNLLSRGYRLQATVEAESPEGAIAVFLIEGEDSERNENEGRGMFRKEAIRLPPRRR